jgi:hypothetical protein
MSTSKHAILSPTGLLTIEASHWVDVAMEAPPRSLQDVAEMAVNARISHLWVMGLEFPDTAENHDAWSFKVLKNRAGKMMGVSVWKRGTGHTTIIFPQYTSWRNCGWVEKASPKEMLVTLAYLEETLGVRVSGSAASTGWAYLKKCHAEWVEEIPGFNLIDAHFRGSSDVIVWQRPLIPVEMKRLYLHKWDKNMDFPNAATTADIGVGTPVHMDGKEACDASQHIKGHPQDVGVWRCTVKKTSTTWMSAGNGQEWEDGTNWIAGPIIRLLRVAGYEVEILEGWVFPERHDVMTKWGNDMWKFRNLFRDKGQWTRPVCAGFAEKATKRMAVAAIGITAFRHFEDDDEKRRPDIRAQVIGREREVMWHNIEKIRRTYDLTPVMVYADAVYYLSDEPDGRAVLPTLVEREGKLGGLKYEGRIAMDDAHIILDAKMAVWQKLEQLNRIGWVQ